MRSILFKWRCGPVELINIALIGLVLCAGLLIGRAKLGFDDHRPVSEQTRDMLWFALLCGLAAFATIEILKRVFGVRGLYQLRMTGAWLERRGSSASSFDGFYVIYELVRAMGVGKSDRDVPRVFNLPTEQLTAQISAAADRALIDPSRYRALVTALSGEPEREPDAMPAKDAGRSPEDPKPAPKDPEQAAAEAKRAAEEAERRADYLLSQSVRAGVDQLQIALGESWRRTLQGAALWIAGAFGLLFSTASKADDGAETRYVLAAVLLGGTIAWIVRDLVAVVERARR